jgi:Protein of unknown function (DUF1493)
MDKLAEQIALELIQLLSDYKRVPPGINQFTELYADLQLGGDDVGDFFSGIEKKFSVSMQDFDISKYFPDEGAMIMEWPFKLIGLKTRLDPSRYQSISFNTLAHEIVKRLKETPKQ